jgi:glycolate oxidase FAD binding subunit
MQLDDLLATIQQALAEQRPLRLRGAGSKDFYGGMLAGDVLELGAYRGIVAYEPTELYITARCGTPLAEIEAELAANNQMLAFEPPHFSGATLGGCVAAGLSGPRRQQAGAVRDFVLGVKLIDGRGQLLNFGGQVMKNVAGYDVSRLLAGSLGTLGVLAEITLKVLPKPVAEETLRFACNQAEALRLLNEWAGQPLPISASFWFDGVLTLRLSGAQAAVAAAQRKLGGERVSEAAGFWVSVREQQHPAFVAPVVWRLALPATAPVLALPASVALEWAGGQRWLQGDLDPAEVRAVAAQAGGHAVLFRAPESLRCLEGAFSSLSPALLALHRRLKKTFDPQGRFNPGRMYAEF